MAEAISQLDGVSSFYFLNMVVVIWTCFHMLVMGISMWTYSLLAIWFWFSICGVTGFYCSIWTVELNIYKKLMFSGNSRIRFPTKYCSWVNGELVKFIKFYRIFVNFYVILFFSLVNIRKWLYALKMIENWNLKPSSVFPRPFLWQKE